MVAFSMKRDELIVRLQTIRAQATRALVLLQSQPLNPDAQKEVQQLAAWLKSELQNECKRMAPERIQRSMTIFELSVYSPTIEEAWTESGISRLKTDAAPNQRWHEVIEAVCYTAAKYLN